MVIQKYKDIKKREMGFSDPD